MSKKWTIDRKNVSKYAGFCQRTDTSDTQTVLTVFCFLFPHFFEFHDDEKTWSHLLYFFFACQRHETTFIPDSSESRRFSWSRTNHVSCRDWSDWEQGKNSVEIEVFTVQNWAVLNISVSFLFFTFFFLSKISFLVFQLKTGFIMSCASSKSFFLIGQFPKRVRTTALLIFTKQINHVIVYIIQADCKNPFSFSIFSREVALQWRPLCSTF